MARPGVLLAAAVFAASAVALHILTVIDGARPIAVALSWVAAACFAVGLGRAAGVGVVEGAAAAAALAAAWYLGAGTPAAVFLPSLAVNLLLAWFFGRTLRGGRVPLVTSIASVVRGVAELPPELARYTRAVTRAWCVFFLAMAAVSAALAAFAPLAAWSLFANVAAAPLVGTMFAAEYAYRRRRLAGHQHVPLRTVLARLFAAGLAITRAAPK
jgi:uncharacterized membrane protein